MSPDETATVLAKCAALDQRTVGRADVLAWHEIVGALELPVALDAVKRWYAAHRERIMPSDVLTLARDIIRERIREANERRALEAAPALDPRPLTDRSKEILDFVRGVGLPEGDPDTLWHGRGHWRQVREARQRAEATQPNPHYDPTALARLAEMSADVPG